MAAATTHEAWLKPFERALAQLVRPAGDAPPVLPSEVAHPLSDRGGGAFVDWAALHPAVHPSGHA